ncbi:vWA domain-containing protein [Kitasatospora sp. NPDC001159]
MTSSAVKPAPDGVGAIDAGPDVRTETERLAGSGTDRPGPYLIGVRHHAPSLSAVLPALLDAARPEAVLVELPAEFQPWLDWLADDATEAPVALAAAPVGPEESTGPAFYPFAEFSPELVALRWARRNGVEAIACDLPLAHRAAARGARPVGRPDAPGVVDALRHRLTGRDSDEDLWDRLVETAAPGSTAEAVRRAALLVGWALRHDAEHGPGVDPYDVRREAWMRARIRDASAGGRRIAVVVGAFHAPALLDGPTAAEEPPGPEDPGHVLSLIPYTYPLLDARSGYPAGIRDPEWQHTVLDAGGDPERLTEALTATAVRICAALRTQDHPSGPADAREIVRLAGDLARLRGHAAPGRGELVEAVQTVLAQGEPLGRGRAVARALEEVLIGTRTGRPTPAAPRSGLTPAVEALLAELGLPGPTDPGPRELRLDPLRSPLDRRREILLHRLTTCGVPYADPVPTTGPGGTETLGTRWRLHWTPATAAMLTVAATRGVTPDQAAEGILRTHLNDDPTPREIIDGLTAAASCALPTLTATRLTQLTTTLPTSATLPDLLDALTLLDRLTAGHFPGATAAAEPLAGVDATPASGQGGAEGLAPVGASAGAGAGDGVLAAALPLVAGVLPVDAPPLGVLPPAGVAAAVAVLPSGAVPSAAPSSGGGQFTAAQEVLTVAAVRQLEGMGGSDDPADARALVELARRADRLGGVRLGYVLGELAERGSPLVRGAAGAVRVLLGQEPAEVFGGRVASWVDGATDVRTRHVLGRALIGLLTAAEGLFDSAPEALEPVLERVGSLPDTAFLDRLPALRGGFDTLSPAARDRLLILVEERLGTRLTALPEQTDPALVARWVRADLVARHALAGRGLLPPEPRHTEPEPAPVPVERSPHPERRTLTPAERWRLLLGRPGNDGLSGRCARLATALDELYGSGHGEGSGPGLDGRSGRGGGREAPFPGVREWAEELEALFGPGVREEVLAAAVASGRTDVLDAIDPAAVRPSVELLRTVLDHAGGLPEARVARLRPLVRRLVDELSRELATRLRPALTGISLPRPSRRPGGGLDLDRTIRANLATARPAPDGTGTLIVPERPVFRTRARQANDWRLILVVDVSGSMEASTVWAALTASILAGVPSLSTHFVAFSTEVLDLTERVADPLSLLLEVRVGGGTSIATGLRYARELVTVPSRTLVAVVSDFEEGGPVTGLLAQTRALVDSGVHLLGCAALDDTGTARYCKAVAGQLVAAGMPVAALSPLELARWVGEKVR